MAPLTLTFKKYPICYTRRIKAFRRLLFSSQHAQIPVPFSGTIHFVDFSFKTPAGIVKVPTTDMQTAFDYAVKASPVLSEYCSQYGKNSIKINNLLSYQVTLRGNTFNDIDVQTWTNELATLHSLPPNDAIIILNPLGTVNTDAPISQGVGGYHGYASIPYLFINVFGTPLTVADQGDFYAVILSHEIAEMVVDPYADLSQPEVCDSCAGNCNVDYRNYFDANGKWLGGSPVIGYAFFTDGVVTPKEAPQCPASTNACIYDPALLGPPVPINPPLSTSFILTAGVLSVGERIGFLATAAGGVQPYTFNWDFGDSGTANGNIVLHTYTAPGTYKVVLTTTDSGLLVFKQTAISTQDLVIVQPAPPVPTLLKLGTVQSPASAIVGAPASFSASATGGTTPYTFKWTFGDGSAIQFGANVSHTYTTAGTFNVILTVIDSGTQSVIATSTITVTAPVPQPTPLTGTVQTPTSASVGEQITVTASVTGGTPPYIANWDFGDGSSSPGLVVSHIYTTVGTYSITVTVQDSGTPAQVLTSTQSIDITVAQPTPPPPPVPNVPKDILEGVKDLSEGTFAEGVSDIISGIIVLFQQGLISKTNVSTAISRLRNALRVAAFSAGRDKEAHLLDELNKLEALMAQVSGNDDVQVIDDGEDTE